MKKLFSLLAGALLILSGMLIVTPEEAKAGDHVGYKKVFLRQHCKSSPEYVCHLSGPPPIKLPSF